MRQQVPDITPEHWLQAQRLVEIFWLRVADHSAICLEFSAIALPNAGKVGSLTPRIQRMA
ncbi:hypothetical protein [Yersinia sp. J1]|uniref:hypothetical protein n=1 Tax=Yersinia sp. J1 TaxID=3424774 RepID=UPI000AABFB9B